MLEVSNLCVNYGGVIALQDVSLRVGQGEIVALIGSNGAGKSTLIKCVSGMAMPRSGEIMYEGQALLKFASHSRASRGIAVVPENRRLFGAMTVMENLMMGAFSRSRFGRLPKLNDDLERIFNYFPRLKERQRQLAQTLSGGEQQMVAIGRALMSRPNLILMDEPSIGLAPLIVKNIFAVISALRAEGRTILLVEQNAAASLRIADRAYVLERGRVHLEGLASAVREMDEVKQLYLGEARS